TASTRATSNRSVQPSATRRGVAPPQPPDKQPPVPQPQDDPPLPQKRRGSLPAAAHAAPSGPPGIGSRRGTLQGKVVIRDVVAPSPHGYQHDALALLLGDAESTEAAESASKSSATAAAIAMDPRANPKKKNVDIKAMVARNAREGVSLLFGDSDAPPVSTSIGVPRMVPPATNIPGDDKVTHHTAHAHGGVIKSVVGGGMKDGVESNNVYSITG
ncbi:hypothetical protein HDU82_002699, partial [Entophlyctis luteolus]